MNSPENERPYIIVDMLPDDDEHGSVSHGSHGSHGRRTVIELGNPIVESGADLDRVIMRVRQEIKETEHRKQSVVGADEACSKSAVVTLPPENADAAALQVAILDAFEESVPRALSSVTTHVPEMLSLVSNATRDRIADANRAATRAYDVRYTFPDISPLFTTLPVMTKNLLLSIASVRKQALDVKIEEIETIGFELTRAVRRVWTCTDWAVRRLRAQLLELEKKRRDWEALFEKRVIGPYRSDILARIFTLSAAWSALMRSYAHLVQHATVSDTVLISAVLQTPADGSASERIAALKRSIRFFQEHVTTYRPQLWERNGTQGASPEYTHRLDALDTAMDLLVASTLAASRARKEMLLERVPSMDPTEVAARLRAFEDAAHTAAAQMERVRAQQSELAAAVTRIEEDVPSGDAASHVVRRMDRWLAHMTALGEEVESVESALGKAQGLRKDIQTMIDDELRASMAFSFQEARHVFQTCVGRFRARARLATATAQTSAKVALARLSETESALGTELFANASGTMPTSTTHCDAQLKLAAMHDFQKRVANITSTHARELKDVVSQLQ